MHSAQLFDKGTERLAKIRDSFDNTYIFKLNRGDDLSYPAAISRGTLVAYGFKPIDKHQPTIFRIPHTQELLDEKSAFQTIPALTVTDKVEVFIDKIGKIMSGESDQDHLTAAIRGIEKLKDMKLRTTPVAKKVDTAPVAPVAAAPAAEPAGPVEYKMQGGTPLLFVPAGTFKKQTHDQYRLISNTTCVDCGEPIELYAVVPIKDGVPQIPSTKKSLTAHKVDGSRTLWKHDACRDKVPAEPAADLSGKQHDLETEEQKRRTTDSPELNVSDQMLSVLNDTTKSADYKLGYMTSYFEQEKKKGR
jgi:hypothetical protein